MKKWEILSAEQRETKTRNNAEYLLDILLSNRGIKTKKERDEFLNPKLESISLDSVQIDKKEVTKTLKRIQQSIDKNEKIIIYGDYDVDGICGAAILWETIYQFYKNVMPHIPHRVDEGYGLSKKGIDHILNEFSDIGLIITVDNGIVAREAVEYANKKNIDVIITDHHVKGEELPKAHSIVHTTKLCGAGVAYMLSKELFSVFSSQSSVNSQSVISASVSKQTNRKQTNSKQKTDIREPITENHLELVALATVADLVPLMGASRALVKFGLEALRRTNRVGLLAMFELAQIKKDEIDVYKIGHIIAPRLNATGRIAHAMDSLRLLCTKDFNKAKSLAMHLHATNRDRQLMTEEATAHANLITEVTENIIVAHDQKYNQGIIGLVASRLVEKHYRPAIVISVGEPFSKGSARSIVGFNIIDFLRTFSVYLIDAGGHPMAAGFTIETKNIEIFKKAISKQASNALSPDSLIRTLIIDKELPFSELNLKIYSEIQKLQPFGMGNLEPVFVARNVKVNNLRTVGRENEHLKLLLYQDGNMFDAIYFRGAVSGIKINDEIDIVYSIERDNWNGNEKIQLKLRDVILTSENNRSSNL